MMIGVPKESQAGETRVALAPDTVKKLCKQGFQILMERGCGVKAGFLDSAYEMEGVQCVDRPTAFAATIILKIHSPTLDEIAFMKKGSLLIALMNPHAGSDPANDVFASLAKAGIQTIALEWIPRTSRAQSMDVLSSQANLAGYRAVIEAAAAYPRFFPLMMTSAGSSRPAKVMVLGAGVAGLQAIATAKRLGAVIEAYDVRPEVKEQIQSLGAQFVEFDLGEEGTGQGGYAKTLSIAAQARQKELLTERLKKQDIIISTAHLPGRQAPLLITEAAVYGMRPGSVIIDMATGSGGNCELSEIDAVCVRRGVTIIGYTNYASKIPADASIFFGNNLMHLLQLFTLSSPSSSSSELIPSHQSKSFKLNFNLNDDIVDATLMIYEGRLRKTQVNPCA